MKAFDGEVDLTGALDFVQEQPEISINGMLKRIACGKFLKAAGVEDGLIEGQGGAFFRVAMHGREIDELMQTINGEMGFYSRDGVIKKWNLLSKIFGLLNVYGWMGGKVEFLKQGLSYKRLGAGFTVADGVFKTKDFVIDSPSMLIKGDGTIDLPKNEIHGSISVPPLLQLTR
jgi:AsmA protein